MSGLPTAAERSLRRRLEEAKRLTALQVDTLAHAVGSLDDEVGWARLTELGTASTVRAQEAASAATLDALNATLEAVDVVGDLVDLPGIRPGQLASGKPVRGMFAATRDIVARRMTAPDTTFPMALDASANALVGFAASEPHRIGRDGQLAVGLSDDRFNRYRRVAVGTTCTFCLMLASRGAVYLTAASAGQGRRYHHMCDCYVELVVDQDAIARSQALQGDWRNAIKDDTRLRQTGAGRDWAEMPDDFVMQQQSREAREEWARRQAARDAVDAMTPVPATTIREVVVITRPDAAKVEALKNERRTLLDQRQVYIDRMAEARAKQAARKAELSTYYPGMTPEEIKNLIRRDYQVRSQQRVINNALKWDRHLGTKIGELDKQIGDLDFDFATSPLAKWQVGEPMATDAAAKGANPQYQTNAKAKVNCGRVVQAVEMRRRGVQVVAKPMDAKRGTMLEIIEGAWVDATGNPRRMRKNIAGKTAMDEMADWPPGARGIMMGSWTRGGAHVWNVEKLSDGTIQFVEGQDASGAFAPNDYIFKMKPASLGLLRVDDLWPTQRMVDVLEAM